MTDVTLPATEFKSTHNLDFLSRPWDCPINDEGWQEFSIGTCVGQWRSTFPRVYEILTIINQKPGNGHLQDVLDWFENSCRRDGYSLVIKEVWNKSFKKHLIEKRGFKASNKDDVIKYFQPHNPTDNTVK